MNEFLLELVRMLDEANRKCDSLRHEKEQIACQLLSAYDDLDELRDSFDLECARSLVLLDANDLLHVELLQVRGELVSTQEKLKNAYQDLKSFHKEEN